MKKSLSEEQGIWWRNCIVLEQKIKKFDTLELDSSRTMNGESNQLEEEQL